MAVPGSDNSVLVKARAMYSDRLTRHDYTALLGMSGAAEIADYLKAKTCYSDALRGFSVSAPYTGQLAALLRSQLFEQFSALCRYEKSIGQSFYKYFILHNDCLQILQKLRTLGENVEEEYVSSLPSSYLGLTDINLLGLMNARTVKDVIACLDGTPYEKILTRSQNLLYGADGILTLEGELYQFYCDELVRIIKADSKGSGRKQLMELVCYCDDIQCIIRLYRLKKLTNANETLLNRFVSKNLTLLTDKEIKSIVSAPDYESMAQAVRNTRYAEIFSGGNPEVASYRMVHERCKKRFRFSEHAPETLWCYMVLRELEINDITNIFEGARCKVPPEYIRQYIYCIEL